MRKPAALAIALSILASCATQPTSSSYKIRPLGPHADGDKFVHESGVLVELASRAPSNRKTIDVKAQIRNKTRSDLLVDVGGAALRSELNSWAPVDWRFYWRGKMARDTASIAPGDDCWLVCTFEIAHRNRERFPKNLTATIGSFSVDGQTLDVGHIQLYMQD